MLVELKCGGRVVHAWSVRTRQQARRVMERVRRTFGDVALPEALCFVVDGARISELSRATPADDEAREPPNLEALDALDLDDLTTASDLGLRVVWDCVRESRDAAQHFIRLNKEIAEKAAHEREDRRREYERLDETVLDLKSQREASRIRHELAEVKQAAMVQAAQAAQPSFGQMLLMGLAQNMFAAYAQHAQLAKGGVKS